MIEIRGGGATRKTAPDSDLTISHSEDKDNLSPKPFKRTCLEEFYEKMIRHSGPDPESINADKNRLRLGGRSDKGGKIIPSSFRHPELDSGSIKIGKDSGSGAGMTKPLPVYLPCHSELAAKSVERESKRDFMPLPCDSETMNEHKTFVMLNLFQHLAQFFSDFLSVETFGYNRPVLIH